MVWYAVVVKAGAKCELEEDGSKHESQEHGEQARIPGHVQNANWRTTGASTSHESKHGSQEHWRHAQNANPKSRESRQTFKSLGTRAWVWSIQWFRVHRAINRQCQCQCQGHETCNYSESERTAKDRGKSPLAHAHALALAHAHALGTDRVRFWVSVRVRF